MPAIKRNIIYSNFSLLIPKSAVKEFKKWHSSPSFPFPFLSPFFLLLFSSFFSLLFLLFLFPSYPLSTHPCTGYTVFMSIQLPEADTEANVPPLPPRPSLFTRVINSVRIYGIPALNFIIITILATFLLKLTFKYSELYVKNSLITIIVTNLVLYGISETLAQSLLSYKRSAAPLSILTSESWMYTVTSDGGNLYRSNQQVHDEPELNDEDQLERFMDYIQGDNDELTSNPPIDPTQLPANSYFEFGRLAGFMCWGFIMAFAQCLWYKFLQIYATDPKFIEVLRKVLTDQLCYSPISLFCFFTYGTMVLESGTWDDTRAKLRQIYLPTLIVNYTVWFPVQFFNFLVVPRSVQVPFSSSISVLWNCYLSMRNSQS